MSDAFAPPPFDYPPLPVDDCVLVLTHMQNDFWHPEGAFYELTRSNLPVPNVLERIKNLIATCRSKGVPLIYHNESFRPGHPELRMRRDGYARGPSKSMGADKLNLAVRGTWGAGVLQELEPDLTRDEFVLENCKVDPFTSTEFEPLLRNLDRNIIILVGLAVNLGIEMTARTASEKDYGVCVLSDCTDRMFGAYSEATMTTILPHFARVTTSDVAVRELGSQ
ncbi:cysteine hydrolase family protein [Sphingomonas sp. SRS2]|uniref:cysteine hydrolase family protein n=1 Tax=Sphingomonas sp. SRS2 TaxID=133190 RepID=UPI00061845BE|nr:cysteine hydrolase [Sphingomonas sp. SRS2]KKC25441.1 hypothetical protein WP12_14500 [Sphingomonas sp. SRS2]